MRLRKCRTRAEQAAILAFLNKLTDDRLDHEPCNKLEVSLCR